MMISDRAPKAACGVSAPLRPATPQSAGRRQPDFLHDCLYLTGLSAILGLTVLCYGGASRPQFEICLVLLGTLAIGYRITRHNSLAPHLPRTWAVPAAAFLLLVVLQIIPLPLGLLATISPARAALAAKATPVLGASGFAPLSVEPASTFAHGARILSYLTVFLLVRELARALRPGRCLLAAPLVGIAAIQACYAVFQWNAGARQGQASGSYVNPNHLAGLLAMALPFAVALAIACWPRGVAAEGVRRNWAGAAAVGAAALIATGVAVSVSRMGLVSAVLGICATWALFWKRSLVGARVGRGAALGLPLLVILAGVVYLAPRKLLTRFASLASANDPLSHGRVPLWRDTLNLVQEYPLLGCGLGAFEGPFLRHKNSEPMLRDEYAHNDYLQALAETGIVGLSILLWALITAGRACLTYCTSSTDRSLLAGAFGAFVAISAHSLTDFNLYIPANAMFVAWTAGIAAAIQEDSRQGAQIHANTAGPRRARFLALRWKCR